MTAQRFYRIAKALSSPRRFEILHHLAARDEVAYSVLADRVAVTQATLSHHLKELVGAGLVKGRREAQYRYYQYRPDVLEAYLQSVRRRIDAGASRHAQPE